MRKILTALVAVAGVAGLAAAAQAGEGCDGMYSASLDVATEESAPMSTPADADGTSVATDTTIKPIPTDQSGG